MKGKKLNIDTIKSRCFDIFGDEYSIISENYVNNKNKIEVKHNKCGNVWKIATHSLLSGCGCPICSGNIKKEIDHVIKKCEEINGLEYSIISDVYINNKLKLEIKHNKCGNIFKMSYNSLSYKKCKCPICNGKRLQNIEIIKERCHVLHGSEYEIVDESYTNSSTKIKIRHNKCYHEWSVLPKLFLNSKTGCPNCNLSKGESRIRNLLESYNIEYIAQKIFADCYYVQNLKFDFYLPKFKICIEFDGVQHFKPVEHFGGYKQFELVKIRDDIKNKYCEENNIKLIRIPYQKYSEIDNILSVIKKAASF